MENLEEMKLFSDTIFNMVKENGVEYIDALISYCEDNEIEIESIIDLISPALKAEIENEAISLRLIKNTDSRLSI